MSFFILIWLLLNGAAGSSSFSCTNSGSCTNENITCDSGSNCNVICTGSNGCRYSTITCAHNYDCTISCGSSGCRNAIIYCPNNATCSLSGSSSSWVRESNIYCGIDGDCQLVSTGTITSYSFRDSYIDARNSNYLYIDSRGLHASQNLTIYCPNNDYDRYSNKSCEISCSSWTTACTFVNIYAIEGLNDLIIDDNIGNTFGDSYIHCGFDYDNTIGYNYFYSCQLNYNSIDFTYYCNDTIANGTLCQSYLIPIPMPTSQPSIPTTNPTYYPSIIPSINPSTNPTIYPSEMPSKIPTNIPTNVPTMIPTFTPSMPSLSPTHNPSRMPTIPTVTPSLMPSTLMPSDMPTTGELEMTSVSTTDKSNDNENSGNGGGYTLSRLETLMVILCSIVLFLILVVLLCCGVVYPMYYKRKDDRAGEFDIELGNAKVNHDEGDRNHQFENNEPVAATKNTQNVGEALRGRESDTEDESQHDNNDDNSSHKDRDNDDNDRPSDGNSESAESSQIAQTDDYVLPGEKTKGEI